MTMTTTATASSSSLRAIRIAHTAIWAMFAGAIVAIPIAAWLEAWRTAVVLIAFVSLECLVLVFNRMRCPLTAVAARYTEDRSPNFDIYLPLWLARYNKHIFGTLFAAGLLITWLPWRA
jgi:hypothetical protein